MYKKKIFVSVYETESFFCLTSRFLRMPLQKGLYPIVAIDNGVQNMTICSIVYYILFCGRCHEQFLLNIHILCTSAILAQKWPYLHIVLFNKRNQFLKSNALTFCSPNCFAPVHIVLDSTKNFFLTINFYFFIHVQQF